MRLLTDDKRFDWEGRIRFDFDIVEYGTGRLTFRTGYDAVLGRERRRYDLNQGNYFFEASTSYRLGEAELSGIISHVSRHLVDRENPPAISWNEAGARVRWERNGDSFELEVTRPMDQAYVDYVWMSRARAEIDHPISKRAELIGSAFGELIGVNHLVRDKRVCGGRLEGGLRINGRAAAVEFFAGYERRIDAYPTDRFRVRMFQLGFRVVSN